jgi:hypothetical protein
VKLSTPSLASKDTLGASKAEPSAPVRFAGSTVSSPALQSAVQATYGGGLLSPEDDVGVGSSTVVRREDEVGVGSSSEVAAPSLTETFAPQTRLETPEPSDDGLLTQVKQIGDAVDGSVQGADSESKWVSVPEPPLHVAGLELEGFASKAKPTPLAVISAEESGLPLSVIVPIDAGDGSSQMPAPGFSVPFAEEFFGFLPEGSMSKDWEDFYSSLPTNRVGMSDSEIIKEVFALPCEVDVSASQSCREEEVSSSGEEINQVVRPSAPARSLLRRGFLGPRAVSPSLMALKEVLPVIKGKEPTTKVGSCSVSTIYVLVIPQVILPSMPKDK